MATPIDFSKYVLNGLKIDYLLRYLVHENDLQSGKKKKKKKAHALADYRAGNTTSKSCFKCFNRTSLLDQSKNGIVLPFNLASLFLYTAQGHLTVAVDYFFNNDLEYLKTSDTEALLEGDFVDLHLNEIEDMLLLAVQHKLFHLDGSDIVDFIMALLMFTRSLILKRRVEDLQLGVESYQKKLNITKPQKTFQGIKFTEPYTPSYDPPGIVYEDLNKQKRVLRANELYKFLDGTLKSVRNEIHHRVLDFCLEYNKEMPKRKWTVVDT
ncbi:hypothetical protein Tco_0381970 [Tanacetum coccineum]